MSHCLNPHCSHPLNSSSKQFCVTCGTKLLLKDRYRAIRPLGAGGMGRTFLAVDEDTPSKRQCVIKQFSPSPEIVGNPEAFQKAKELFNREAATLDRLGDISNQIPVLLAYLEQDQRLYLVQEFVDGQNLLSELSEQGHYSEAQIQQLLNGLLPVLQLIHQQGLIHRDIKPENIMRQQGGQLILIDFGLSKELNGTMMAPGTRGGTLGYAPLEQMAYGEAFPSSDLYAIGATCVHLLTGEYPHNLYNLREKRWRWREALASRGGQISETLGQVLDKLLQENYQQRYKTVEAVLADLRPQPAPPPAAPPPTLTPVLSLRPATPPVIFHSEQTSTNSTQQPALKRAFWGGGVVILAILGGYGLWSSITSAPALFRQEEIATAPGLSLSSEPVKMAEDYIYEGHTFQNNENYSAALEAFEKAIELDPTLAEAYVGRGLAHYFLDNNQLAVADYSTAIELDPNYADAYNKRGNVKYYWKDYQGAIVDYDEAIRLKSDDAIVYSNRANAHRNLVQNLPAIADYTKAIELDPNLADAYYNRGLIHQATGHVQEARSDFTTAANLYQAQGNPEYQQEALDRLKELP